MGKPPSAQPADLLLLDEPANDLDIPALKVLEESLAEFPGALVLVSHDRELMDRLCTEVIGLDGRGGAAIYASVNQWLTAMDRLDAETAKRAQKKTTPSSPRSSSKAAKTTKLSYHEKKELAGMEAAILAAEELLANRQTAVEQSATAGHVALADACRELELAQQEVDRLYARWEELEAKRGGS